MPQSLPPGAVVDETPTGLPPGAVVDSGTESNDTSTGETVDKGFVNPFGYNRDKTVGFSDRFSSLIGMGDIALMGAQAGAAEILSGYGGLIALAYTGDNDYAKNRVDAWQGFLSRGPWSEGGEKILEALAPPLSKAEMAITDFAEKRSKDDEGNIDPEVATAIKTGILGSIDLVAAVVPGGKAILANAKLFAMRKSIVAEARRLGIDMHLDHFADDVADAAKMIGSESAGEAATEYVTAIRNAEYLARLKKNSLYMQGLDEKLFVSTSPVRKMGAELARDLDQDFDLTLPKDGGQVGMNLVMRSLDDMHSRRLGFGSGQTLAVHFNQFERLRKRLNWRIRDTAKNPKAASANAALTRIKNTMDDWMTAEFNKAAMANGQAMTSGNALSGDVQGFTTYLEARKAATEHAWFNETKVIADLIKKDASVDQAAQWLIGASAMGKRGGAAVVERLNTVLGKDSAAMSALREDFIFNLTEPILKPSPTHADYTRFINNYERVLKKNKPLADALGLQQSDVAILADYALVARQLPESGHFYSAREVVSTIARLGVGHGVAKGAARVTFATKVLNYMGRIDKVTEKQITGAVIDSRFDQPLVPKGTPVYTALMAGAALTGLNEDDK